MGAVAIAAALGLGGCTDRIDPPPTTPVTLTPPSPFVAAEDAPPMPLPPPEALIDVMVRLTDPAVPGAEKVGLIQFGKPTDGPALDSFDRAISDAGFRPLVFEAHDLQYVQGDRGNVTASFVIRTANPRVGDGGDFRFPMEFAHGDGTWQLTRQTADMLLEFGGSPAPPAPPVVTEPAPPPP
ncbi:hypothetical protein [Mycolicibacterium sp. XJ1819]